MSEVSSYPRLRSVASARLAAVQRVSELVRSVGEVLPCVSPQVTAGPPLRIECSTSLRGRFNLRKAALVEELRSRGVRPREAEVEATLSALREGSFAFSDGAALREPLAALQNAPSLTAARGASRALLREVTSAHDALLAGGLREACLGAFERIGLTSTEILRENRPVRLSGSDGKGRILVAEISTDETGRVELAAESLGPCDGHSTALLTDFDRALEAEGVAAGPPRRRGTGGLRQLEAARQYFSQPPRRTQGATVPAAAGRGRHASRHQARARVSVLGRSR